MKEAEKMVEEGMAAESDKITQALNQAEAALKQEQARADQAEAALQEVQELLEQERNRMTELQELLEQERNRMAESLQAEKARAGMAVMECAMMTDELERQKSLWLEKHGSTQRKETKEEAWAAADMAMQALESALELSPQKAQTSPQMLALD